VQSRPVSATKGMPPLVHRLMLLPGPVARCSASCCGPLRDGPPSGWPR
jgi:hypothetical protein